MWSYSCCTPCPPTCWGGYYDPAYWQQWQPGYSHWHAGPGAPEPRMSVPEELSADTASPTKETTIGGAEKAYLSLEYTADAGATSPKVTVTITDSSGSIDCSLTSFPAGYHVKRSFAFAAPGAKVKLEVAECSAHLRWFELVS